MYCKVHTRRPPMGSGAAAVINQISSGIRPTVLERAPHGLGHQAVRVALFVERIEFFQLGAMAAVGLRRLGLAAFLRTPMQSATPAPEVSRSYSSSKGEGKVMLNSWLCPRPSACASACSSRTTGT